MREREKQATNALHNKRRRGTRLTKTERMHRDGFWRFLHKNKDVHKQKIPMNNSKSLVKIMNTVVEDSLITSCLT